MMRVLALDMAGTPRDWISIEQAIIYKAKDLVGWFLGEDIAMYRGGIQRISGNQSTITTPSIIAVRNRSFVNTRERHIPLTNNTLFERDKRVCAYCARSLSLSICTRDHIIPRAKGGKNAWMNVVTACKKCNHFKGSQSLKEANMQLAYVPYVPNFYEHMILQNRNILADQMDYLISGVSKESRLLVA